MKNLLKKKDTTSSPYTDPKFKNEVQKRHQRFLNKIKTSKESTQSDEMSDSIHDRNTTNDAPLPDTASIDKQIQSQGFAYDDTAMMAEIEDEVSQLVAPELATGFAESHLSSDVDTPMRVDTHPELDLRINREGDMGIPALSAPAVSKMQWLLYGLLALLLLTVIALVVMMLPGWLGNDNEAVVIEQTTVAPPAEMTDTTVASGIDNVETGAGQLGGVPIPEEAIAVPITPSVELNTNPEADPEVQAAIEAAISNPQNGQQETNDTFSQDTQSNSISYDEFLRQSETPVYVAPDDEIPTDVTNTAPQNTVNQNTTSTDPRPTVPTTNNRPNTSVPNRTGSGTHGVSGVGGVAP